PPSSRPVPPTQTPEQRPSTRLAVASPRPPQRHPAQQPCSRRLRVAPPRRTTGARAAPSPRRHPPFARRCTATSRPASSVDCASAAAPRTPQVRIDAIPGGRARAVDQRARPHRSLAPRSANAGGIRPLGRSLPPLPPHAQIRPNAPPPPFPTTSHAAPAPHPLPTKSHPFRRPIKRPLAHAAQTPCTRRRCPSRPPASLRGGRTSD
ncbi:hypothetical protein B0H15DRAFT_871135, partial [Mycena belliarum]